LLGISIPFQSMLTSCNKENIEPNGFSGSVLIIGAGAAGMTSGYLLEQKGIDFQILEASSTYGGRMKRTTSFVDFPIPLGAEWLHVEESELTNIINNAASQIGIQFYGYQPQEQIGYYENGNLTYSSLAEEFGNDFIDKKFINTTWLDFFEEYVVPSISSKISFDVQIVSVDYQGDKVIATDNNGQTYEADKLIITVPLKILQDNDIIFSPPLPSAHSNAIQDAPIWGGLKVFLEFSQKFYPAYLTFPDSETNTGQRIYYDAAFGQNSSSNVLGFVALGEQAIQYQELTGDAQKDYILNELDDIFNGLASQNYIKHIVQDWDNEPYIRSAYLADVASSNISNSLSQSIDEKVYFAGEAYTQEDDWGGVHNATQSARDVVNEFV
jgi:monoamine oxidase